MSEPVLVALLGVTTATAWGVSDFFAAKSTKIVGPVLAMAADNFIGAFMFLVIYALWMHPHMPHDLAGVAYAAAGGAVIILGAGAFFIGLEAGPVSIVSPLSSMYPLVTALLALLVFHAHLTGIELIGIILVLLGVMAASGLLGSPRAARGLTKGPAFALLCALGWGIGYALLAQGIARLGWETATAVEFASVCLALLALVPLIKRDEVVSPKTITHALKNEMPRASARGIFLPRTSNSKLLLVRPPKVGGSYSGPLAGVWRAKANKFVWLASLTQLLGVLTINIGLSKSASSGGAIITAISACYPILTIFLALKHFNEEARLVPLVGAGVGIAGVVMLSLG